VPSEITNLVNLCTLDNIDPPCYGYYELNLGYNYLNVPASEPPASFLAIKDPDWYLTQAVQEVVNGTSGGSLVSNDTNTEITVPPDAVSGDVTFLFVPQPQPTQEIGTHNFAGYSFELTAWDSFSNPVTTFSEPLIFTIHYDEASLGSIGEGTLCLYYWEDTLSTWVDVVTTTIGGTYTRNLDENWLSVPVGHLSEFALLGVVLDFNYYLPLILQ
jgi:hypothetical protein